MVTGIGLLGVAVPMAGQAERSGSVGGEVVAALASSPPLTQPSGQPQRGTVQRGALPGAARAITPTRLRIPAISVDAAVKPVGVDPRSGDLAVPPRVDVVGWYRFGPGLGAESGSIVIAGHVDSAALGRGAYFRLRELGRGDTFEVAGSDGALRRFRVVAREEWAKSAIALERYFDRAGQPRLTLITCGGPFDTRARAYRDNVVVTAVPVDVRGSD